MISFPFEVAVLICFIVAVLTISDASQYDIPITEYDALEELYTATLGDRWHWRRTDRHGPIWFNGTEPCQDPPWQGLQCSCNELGNCNIVNIDLKRYGLKGIIPSSISSFSELQRLNLSENNLQRTLPASLGQLNNLEYLSIVRSGFTGPIPDELFNATNLIELILYDNVLDGTISSLVSKLTNLQWLDLGSNSLQGPIPHELGRLSKLKHLLLYQNYLTGSIPEELYNLTQLTIFDLGDNFLAGTLSESVGRLVNLMQYDMNQNNFHGSIPSAYGDLPIIHDIYINNNLLNGTIPETLYNASTLRSLDISHNLITGTISVKIEQFVDMRILIYEYNMLTGTIPASISNCKKLAFLYINSNELNGSIPEEFYGLDHMVIVLVDANYLTGTISNSISNFKALTELRVESNYLSGTLPAVIGNLTLLSSIKVDGNDFTGHISENYCNARILEAFYFQDNHFSGTIAPCMMTQLKVLSEFIIYGNLLTGILPNNMSEIALENYLVYNNGFTGPLPSLSNRQLQFFVAYNNLITGTIPENLFFKKSNVISQIELQNNLISGTLSRSIDLLNVTQYLDFSYNILSGTIPRQLSNIIVLQTFFVNNNHFSGPLECFSEEQFLSNINLSNNQFTGTIPVAPFLNTTLLSFTAVENCFTGTIPAEICNATQLSTLALDGLHTSRGCQIRLLPRISKSYTLSYYTPGSLPECLFQMKNIETLHVSGNGLETSLSYDLGVSSSLSDLALSYNQLTSSVPKEIGELVFSKLDLSFNRLGGVLPTSLEHMNSNISLYYQVNRMSGQIPSEMRDVQNIDILNGNHFECQLDRKQLPRRDKEYSNYDCGTSSLEHSTYAWVGLFLASVVLVIFISSTHRCQKTMKRIVEWHKGINRNLHSWWRVYTAEMRGDLYAHQLFDLAMFGAFMRRLRMSFLVVTLFITIVLIPVNIAISHFYGTYLYKYAWSVASVYLSGFVPAIILLVFFSMFLLWLFGCFYFYMVSFTTVSSHRDSVVDANKSASTDFVRFYKHYLSLLLIAVFNFVVVLAINIGYVIVSTSYGSGVVVVTQIVLASFKLMWNDLAIRNMTGLTHKYNSKRDQLTKEEENAWEGKYMTFNTSTMIFNVIVIPCLATAAVSSDCFYDVLVEPDPVVSSFTYKTCSSLQSIVQLRVSSCPSYITVTATTSYSPPYMYRYQCSSTLVTTYAILYVYKFIITAFFQPLLVLLIVRLSKNLDPDSRLFKFIQAFVPQVYRSNARFVTGDRRLFHKDRFNLRIIMYLSIFVTFGVIFPPLAVMICVSVFVQSYFSQMSIGRVIETTAVDSDERRKLLSNVNEDCRNVGVMFKQTVYAVGPSAAFLYGFIIFDTYGDTVGGSHALWMAVVMFCVGCALTVVFKLIVMREPAMIRNVGFYSSTDKIEMKVLMAGKSSLHLETSEKQEYDSTVIG